MVAVRAFGLPAYVNTDCGQGTVGPRRIQVDAQMRMVTTERSSCNAELVIGQEVAVDLMDNAVALPTTPQRINYNHQALFTKKRPHVTVGPRKGAHH